MKPWLLNEPKQITRLISFTFLIQILYSIKLWTSPRDFPLVPVFEVLQYFNEQISNILSLLLLLSLLINIFKPKVQNTNLILILVLFLSFLDINRLQPWVYLYLVMYLLFIISKLLSNKLIFSFGLKTVLVALYFWSGISKLNYSFLDNTFIAIITNCFGVNDLTFFNSYKEIGFGIPLLEILTAVLLVTKRNPRAGIFLAILSHLFIIYFVSPFGIGNDYIVIPWNILMIIILVIISKDRKVQDGFTWLNTKELKVKVAIVVFIFLLPALNLIGKWDNFCSFNLYSDKHKHLLVIIEDVHFTTHEIPYENQFKKFKDLEGGKVLNLSKWSFEVLKTPYYPETWVVDRICRRFCDLNLPNDGLVYLRFVGSLRDKNLKKMTCNDFTR